MFKFIASFVVSDAANFLKSKPSRQIASITITACNRRPTGAAGPPGCAVGAATGAPVGGIIAVVEEALLGSFCSVGVPEAMRAVPLVSEAINEAPLMHTGTVIGEADTCGIAIAPEAVTLGIFFAPLIVEAMEN